MRCAIYARVSTEEQVGQYGLEAQLSELRAHAQKKGYVTSSSLEFIDDGYSGADLDRPALTRLRQLAAQHGVDVILVHDPDRLARSLVHQLILDAEFEKAGVRLEFLTMPNESTPEGRLHRQMRGVIAEFEREKIRERTLRGRRQKARQGYIVGGRTPYGYRYLGKADGERGRYIVNEDEADVVRQIFRWVAEGLSVREITARLNELRLSPQRGLRWGRSSVHRILANPVYAGTAFYNRRERVVPLQPRTPETHRHNKKTALRLRPSADWISVPVPAIIDPALFEQVHVRLQRNVELSSGRNSRFYLLRGLLRCGACGRKFIGVPSHGRQYYRCQGRDRLAKPRCGAGTLGASGIESFVWGAVVEILKDPALLREKVTRHFDTLGPTTAKLEAQPARLERSLAAIEQQLSRALDAYIRIGSLKLPELEAKIEDLNKQKSALETALQQARAEEAKHSGQESRERQIEEFCRLALRGLNSLDPEGRQRLLRSMIDEIKVTGWEVEITGILPGRTPPPANRTTEHPEPPVDNRPQRPDDRAAGLW